MVSEKTKLEKLRELKDKRSTAWLDCMTLGVEIRDLEGQVHELTPQDRVAREVKQNWDLTLKILRKVGFIQSDRWDDLDYDKKRAVCTFHRIRRDVRKAIARGLRIHIEDGE